MPSIPRTATAFLSLLVTSTFANAAPAPDAMEDTRLEKRALTYVGCFSSSTPLTETNTYEYQSQGYCSDHCDGTAIGLTNGDTCYCGTTLPAEDDKVDDSKCDTGCTGWGQSMCGGDGFWTVYETQSNVPYYESDGSSSSSSGTKSGSQTSSNAPTIVTSEVAGGSTIMVTVTPTSVADAAQSSGGSGSSGGGGSNTAGIAAGVVVGVVAIVGAAVGIFFLLRHRKQKQAEEDFKQRTQVSDFMRGASERKPPGSGYSGTSDSRLDPEAGRRNSVGSLADNQDYSRRILRVANPDSS